MPRLKRLRAGDAEPLKAGNRAVGKRSLSTPGITDKQAFKRRIFPPRLCVCCLQEGRHNLWAVAEFDTWSVCGRHYFKQSAMAQQRMGSSLN